MEAKLLVLWVSAELQIISYSHHIIAATISFLIFYGVVCIGSVSLYKQPPPQLAHRSYGGHWQLLLGVCVLLFTASCS